MPPESELVPPPLPPPAPPRVWSPILVAVFGVLAAMTVAGTAQVIALIVLLGPKFKTDQIASMFDVLAAVPWGAWVSILPGQVVMFGAAIGAACLSPEPLKTRLGYTTSRLPWWCLPLLLGGTLFAGIGGGVLIQSLFKDPGVNLLFFVKLVQNAHGWNFVALIGLLCVIPAIVEETLFRGYVQRRLLQRWSPLAAITVSTLLFVLAHFDPVHVIAVVPLGAWLGIVAWRAGALWPGMICHFTQNLLAILNARSFDPNEAAITPQTLTTLAITGLFGMAAIVIMRRYPKPAEPVEAAAL